MTSILEKCLAVAVGILLAITIGFGVRNWVLGSEIDTKNAQIESLKIANEVMKASVDTQNDAIEAMRMRDVVLKKKAEDAQKEASKAADKHKEKSVIIKNQVVTGDDCQSANKLITDYMRGEGL